MLSKFLDPKNDLAFARIFGTERNKDILIHFLNDIFGYTTDPIVQVTFLKNRQDPMIAAQRVSIVDILCQDTLGNHFIVEMQVAREPGFEKRAQYYAAKTYIEQRKKGLEYHHLKRVTFLSIADFILFPNKPNYLSHHVILDKNSYEHDLQDFSFSFLELPKFKKTQAQLVTLTEKWAYFFKHAEDTHESELPQLVGTDKIIERAL
jgi:predicted transposase/invertase (TIGR01784 family)